MDVEQEIHNINTRITDLTDLFNSIVRKIGNVAVIKNQQENDKATVDNLALELKEFITIVGELNTNVATMNGIAKGKQSMWLLFGGFITLSIVGVVTTVILHNSTLDVHSSEIKAIEARVKVLEAK